MYKENGGIGGKDNGRRKENNLDVNRTMNEGGAVNAEILLGNVDTYLSRCVAWGPSGACEPVCLNNYTEVI